MPIFQVYSRNVTTPFATAKQRPSRARPWRVILWRLAIGGLIIAFLASLLGRIGLSAVFFLLLPVVVTLIGAIVTRQIHLYQRGRLLLTCCISLLYFSAVTGWELLTHGPQTQELIVVTTTLALAALFEPVRDVVQRLLEQRFHVQDDEATRLIGAYISTLREEIAFPRIRDGLFDVVQKAMRPQSLAFWVRQPGQGTTSTPQQHTDSLEHMAVTVADDDAMLPYALREAGLWDVSHLRLDSPALNQVRATAALALPLISQGELIGLIALGLRLDGERYTREDRALLTALAAQVAPALRVSQLAQAQHDQLRERERIEQELRMAREIQQAFLPGDTPTLPGWLLTPYYQPAREVGGDFYDFIPCGDGQIGLVIGDVTGKGIPAALVMATVHTMLRTAAQDITSPSDVLARVNELLFAETPPEMFVTCFYATLDPACGRLRYANAGHEPPYRLGAGSAAELWATGMPLGMMPGTRYEEYETSLTSGERLLFYSDGLVEAHNPTREMFGFARLQAWLAAHADAPALVDELVGELHRFTGDEQEPEDDVTLLFVQHLSERARSVGAKPASQQRC